MKLSPQTIYALAERISDSSQNDPPPAIGLNRSDPRTERFMLACGVAMSVGDGSRVPLEGLRFGPVSHAAPIQSRYGSINHFLIVGDGIRVGDILHCA